MSKPKLITPLLDNHLMGDPISDSHGVRCCPAIHKETEEKFIVKIISVPASQVQLEALLLTGAYPDADAAGKYFKELADDIAAEANQLQKLARLEGFQAFRDWQIVPMEDETGFDVYLLSEYSLTLERHMRRNGMTHLNAVNLGLDLCAALSVCRRNGHLYVDLKPENVVISENRGYLISDIGFISLSSLKYASLPEKYRSCYTAPEIQDAYSALNTTLDTYAVGMILYQVFNGGQLPDPCQDMAPPAYADHDMARIILKACAADPSQRWQDPQEMGQALVCYMQCHTVNDTPIVPVAAPDSVPGVTDVAGDKGAVSVEAAVETVYDDTCEVFDEEPAVVEETPGVIDEEPAVVEETPEVVDEEPAVVEEVPEAIDEEPAVVEEAPEVVDEEPAVVEEAPEVVDEEPAVVEEAPEVVDEEPAVVEETPEVIDEEPAVVEEAPEVVDEEPADDDTEQIAIDGFLFVGEEIPVELPEGELTDEVSSMLAQADELIAHKAPDPVVAPEPIDVPMPEPLLPEEPEIVEEAPVDAVPQDEVPKETDTSPEETEEEVCEIADAVEDDEEDEEAAAPPTLLKRPGCLIAELIALLLLAVSIFVGIHFYNNYYLQNIASITPMGEEDWLTITLDTEIDNELLTIVCTDTYGNKLTQPVSNNSATFTSLPSGTTYKITVQIDGFHQLTGATTSTYTTATQSNVVSFTAVTGEIDGSVILNFSVPGDNTNWQIKYWATGEQPKTVNCNGHMAMITGLTVGKTYTFRLKSADGLYVVGNDTVTLTASDVIYADNLTIHGFKNGALIADWTVSDLASVESWTVRCYNSNGYDATFVVNEPRISIEGLDLSQGYNLEVKAQGMSVSRRAEISANSVTFKDILMDQSVPGKLVITWNYEGTAPADGWQLSYNIDGGETITVICDKNTYTLENPVPGGVYSFTFLFPDNVSVYGEEFSCTVPKAEKFSGYTVSASNMTVRMCRRPDKNNWTYSDVPNSSYTNNFEIGTKAAFVFRLTKEYITSSDIINVLFVIRNENGGVLNASTFSSSWTNLWYKGYCELDLPVLPDQAGTYTVEIYFSGAYITAEPMTFTVY